MKLWAGRVGDRRSGGSVKMRPFSDGVIAIIIAEQGRDSLLAAAIGNDWKGKLSPVLYLAAIPLAFVSVWISNGLFILVALMWLVPDRRIERVLSNRKPE